MCCLLSPVIFPLKSQAWLLSLCRWLPSLFSCVPPLKLLRRDMYICVSLLSADDVALHPPCFYAHFDFISPSVFVNVQIQNAFRTILVNKEQEETVPRPSLTHHQTGTTGWLLSFAVSFSNKTFPSLWDHSKQMALFQWFSVLMFFASFFTPANILTQNITSTVIWSNFVPKSKSA